MAPPISIRHLLPGSPFICFVVPGLFSAGECAVLLHDDIRRSFQRANANYPVYYRNNDRLVVDDEQLSARLFDKVQAYLPATINTESAIEAENGNWSLAALNTRLRFCKYSSQQYFHRHLDGIYYKSDTEQSKLTFMIYLNSATDFEGGRTLFYQTRESTEPWAVYIPQQGDLIVFDHNVWHEGELLHAGEKFVLRSDIIYQRASDRRPRQPFEAHLGYIWAIKQLDDDTLLSGGRDKKINIWNQTGELRQSLPGHDNSVLCIAPMDKDVFITGSRDRQVIVWRRQPGTDQFARATAFCLHDAVVLTLCRLTEELFASGAEDNLVKIWNIDSRECLATLPHHNFVQSLELMGDQLMSASFDGRIARWHLPSV